MRYSNIHIIVTSIVSAQTWTTTIRVDLENMVITIGNDEEFSTKKSIN